MAAGEVKPDDENVLNRARRGDAAAFTELVRLHQDGVYTLALRLTGDRELAADVSQEALVRAWRALPRFRGDARFSTWLHRITVNTAWTLRRRSQRHRADAIHDLALEPEADVLTPERAGEARHLREKLMTALDELSPATRIVVVLKDVYEWSHLEISEHLGITQTAAKVRLHRGRRRLREALWAEAEAE